MIPDPLESHIGQLVTSELPEAAALRGGVGATLNVITLSHLIGPDLAETVTLDDLHAVVDLQLAPLLERPHPPFVDRAFADWSAKGSRMPVVAKVALLELMAPEAP